MSRDRNQQSQFYYLLRLNLAVIGLVIYSSIIVLANDACPALNFNSAPNYPTGTQPISVASGDFNGDGIYDLAVVNDYPDTRISILLGDNNAGFTSAGSVKLDATAPPGFVTVGDFNNDGKTDLAATSIGYSDVWIMLGNGRGGFSSPSPYQAGLKPRFILVNDFNKDGRPDLAVANEESKNLSILLGDGTGGFAAPNNIPLFIYAHEIEMGDFNNDDKTDLIAVSRVASSTILFGDGAGNFAPQLPLLTFGSMHVVVADFNSDGNADIVASGNSPRVNFGDGTGRFPTSKAFPGVGPSGLELGDFNRDGKADVAMSSMAYNQVSILQGDGLGNFSRTDFAAGVQPSGILVKDFNHDAKSDLAVINMGSHNVSILLGDGAGGLGASRNYHSIKPGAGGGNDANSIATGDFNHDGKADLAVTNFFSSNFSVLLNDGNGAFKKPVSYSLPYPPKSIAAADFNKDGNTDLVIAHISSPYTSGEGSSVVTFLGRSDGTFFEDFNFSWLVGGDAFFVTAGDINGDGRSDIAFLSNGKVRVALSTGKTFNLVSANFSAGAKPISLSLGDVNGDGKIDFVVPNHRGVASDGLIVKDELLIAFGNGEGGISGTQRLNVGETPNHVAMQDLNGDGRLDLAITVGSVVSVLINNGAGGFAPPNNIVIVGSPGDIAAGDFDADGKLDLAAVSSSNGELKVLRGDGTGQFAAPVGYGTGTDPVALLVNDFNNDGKSDVATANYISSNITVLLSASCPTGPLSSNIQMGQAIYSAAEETGAINIQVTRSGTTSAASVDYVTADNSGNNSCRTVNGIASSRCDYSARAGTLQFAAGESSKTISIPIVDDNIVEGDEKFTITLSNPSEAILGNISGAAITIKDNDLVSTPPHLIMDQTGSDSTQAAALDSILFLRDPFPVVSQAALLSKEADKNTRVIFFVTNLQLAQDETAFSIIVNVVDSANQIYQITAEDVRVVPGFNFTQVIFRLPNGLAPGTAAIKVKANGQESNSGTIRIKN